MKNQEKKTQDTAVKGNTNGAKTKDLDTKSAAHVAKKITEKKDLKYNYPSDCDTLPKRKVFRRQARAKVDQLTKAIEKLALSQEPGAEKQLRETRAELKDFKQLILVPEKVKVSTKTQN